MEKQSMRTGKANGWGVFSYHWVEMPLNEDEEISASFHLAKSWCEEMLGTDSKRWFIKKEKFYFQSEQDMTMFILRWT